MGSFMSKRKRGSTWEQTLVRGIQEELIQREMGVFVTATRSGFTMLLLFALLLDYSNAFHDILRMCK